MLDCLETPTLEPRRGALDLAELGTGDAYPGPSTESPHTPMYRNSSHRSCRRVAKPDLTDSSGPQRSENHPAIVDPFPMDEHPPFAPTAVDAGT